jgi:hypothetical protein
VVFGYDGSELARAAIAEAGGQLPAHRDALVVTVWSTFNVEFVPEPGTHFDSACADEVKQAAEQTAARGAALAKAAGSTRRPSRSRARPPGRPLQIPPTTTTRASSSSPPVAVAG